MAGLPLYCLSAVLGDVVVELLRAFHLADDRGAGVFLQDESGEEQEKLIAPEDLTAVGDHTDPVCVSIIGNPDVGPFRVDDADQIPEVFRGGRGGDGGGE